MGNYEVVTRPARILKPAIIWQRKPQPWLRDRDHLAWVGTLPCLSCGRRGCSIAAHVRLRTDGAGARKPSDFYTVPLCDITKLPPPIIACHQIQHGMSEELFWSLLQEKGVSDPWTVAERLWRISGDDALGWRAIAHARPGLRTALLEAA